MTHHFHDDSLGRSPTSIDDGIGAAAAQAALRLTDRTQDDAAPWSAHHLPKPKASRTLRFSVVAVAVGLAAAVLASAVSNPIRTTGTQMEPKRFQTTTAQPPGAPAGLAVANSAP